MGLDTKNPTTLWKDKALVELNLAVLYSFQVNTNLVTKLNYKRKEGLNATTHDLKIE